MEFTIVINIWLLFVLLSLSAFFSSSETALFSLGTLAAEKIRKKGHKSYKYISLLLSQPRRTLISILVGNEFTNNAFSIVMAYVVYKIFQDKVALPLLTFLPVLFAWPILVFAGEILPKTVAVRAPDRISTLNSPMLHYFSKAIYPLRFLLKAAVDFLSRPFLGRKGKQDSIIDEDFFKVFVEMGREEGALDEDEKGLIDRVFVLDDIRAEQIMTPAHMVAGINLNFSYRKVIDFIKKERYSRIPVYNESKDAVVGILNVKDLIGFKYREEKDFRGFIIANLKEPIYIESGTKILDLLRDFQLRRKHMGIVLDPSGKMAGVVTLEDVLEELFGDIKDEYDVEEGLWKKTPDGRIRFDLSINALRFAEISNYDLPPGDFRTLGELLGVIMGRRPLEGDEIVDLRFKMQVQKEGERLFAFVTLFDEVKA